MVSSKINVHECVFTFSCNVVVSDTKYVLLVPNLNKICYSLCVQAQGHIVVNAARSVSVLCLCIQSHIYFSVEIYFRLLLQDHFNFLTLCPWEVHLSVIPSMYTVQHLACGSYFFWTTFVGSGVVLCMFKQPFCYLIFFLLQCILLSWIHYYHFVK